VSSCSQVVPSPEVVNNHHVKDPQSVPPSPIATI
jgi:hypothetical protein